MTQSIATLLTPALPNGRYFTKVEYDDEGTSKEINCGDIFGSDIFLVGSETATGQILLHFLPVCDAKNFNAEGNTVC